MNLQNSVLISTGYEKLSFLSFVEMKYVYLILFCFCFAFLVHTRPIFEMSELEQRFEISITSSFNTLRELIAKFIDFQVPSAYVNDAQPLEFIRLYDIENNQPTSIVHEPVLTTLK